MDKREFIQRFVIETYKDDGKNLDRIIIANNLFKKIEESLVESVASTDLWKNNDK